MKSFIKYLALASVLAFAGINTNAATITLTTNLTSGQTNVVYPRSATVTAIIVQNTNATSHNISLYDAYNTALIIYTNLAFTNYTSYITNHVTVFTNVLGLTNHRTFTASQIVTNVVPQVLVTNKPVIQFTAILSNNTVLTPLSAYFGRGVLLSNAGSVSVTLQIDQ